MKELRPIPVMTLILVCIISILKVVTYYEDLNKTTETNEILIEKVVNTKINKTTKKEEIKIDFDKLKKTNSDTVGWIKLNQNKINNPIVQSKDNSYYLTRSFNKKPSQVGTIFMDYRNKSFDDQNVVIFGHAIKDGTMFGSLVDIFKKDYFSKKENNYIQIIDTNNKVLTYQIFSYYITEKEEYYITPSFKTDKEFTTFLNTIKKRSNKNFNIELTKDDHILTLSTCVGVGETTRRRVIHAKRIDNLK